MGDLDRAEHHARRAIEMAHQAGGLANLNARMNGLVYRIDRLGGDPNGLAGLESAAAEFLLPDTTPPVVTVAPPGTLFTGTLMVGLLSDEPATICYTLDGSDPMPGGGSTFAGVDEVTGISISADTTLSWMATDTPWLNQSGISRVTYLSDMDADAIADLTDNCPSGYNPDQENFDGDPEGDVCDPDDDDDLYADAADCRPMDNTLWAAPGEFPIDLDLLDETTLQWTSLAAAAGPATRYDVIRGPVSDLVTAEPGQQFDGATCLLDNGAALSLTDTETPALQAIVYYLIRGENPCGTGIYGRGTDGMEEVALACP